MAGHPPTKAVFFDVYETLVRLEPDRGVQQAEACRAEGIDMTPEAALRGYSVADVYWEEETGRRPLSQRSEEQLMAFYAEYERRLLEKAGMPVSPEEALRVFMRIRRGRPPNFALYDDALPALAMLRERGLTIGTISNIPNGMYGIPEKLGLAPYLDLQVTSDTVGASKPDKRIFLAAVEQAGVQPAEAIHVGDRYMSDVKGALGAGLRALLLDRYDAWPDITDIPRIRSLLEVAEHL